MMMNLRGKGKALLEEEKEWILASRESSFSTCGSVLLTWIGTKSTRHFLTWSKSCTSALSRQWAGSWLRIQTTFKARSVESALQPYRGVRKVLSQRVREQISPPLFFFQGRAEEVRNKDYVTIYYICIYLSNLYGHLCLYFIFMHDWVQFASIIYLAQIERT